MSPDPAGERRARLVLLPITTFLALVVVLAFLVFRFFILDFVVAASISLLMAAAAAAEQHARRKAVDRGGDAGGAHDADHLRAGALQPADPGQPDRHVPHWLAPRLKPARAAAVAAGLAEQLPAARGLARPATAVGCADPVGRAAAPRRRGQHRLQGTIARFTAALFDIMLFLLMLFFPAEGRRIPCARSSTACPFTEQQETLIFDHIGRTVKAVLQAMVVVPVVQG
jgi:hypothetical protein